MSLTDCEISGPMPSPSIKVTVNLPWIHQLLKLRLEIAKRGTYIVAFLSLELCYLFVC